MPEYPDIEGRGGPTLRVEGLGEVLGGFARELRNYLAAVQGRIDLARGSSPGFEGAESHLQEALSACDRAASMARRLVRLGGRRPRAPQPVSLDSVVESVGSRVRRAGAPVRVMTSGAGEAPPTVLADRRQIEEAIAALIELVRPGLPEGATIDVSCGAMHVDEPEAGRAAWVKPGDYGRIEVGQRQRRFDARFRGLFDGSPVREDAAGADLVLAIAYSIVKQHRGYLDVGTLESGGSAFWIDLPAVPRDRSPAAGSPSGASPSGERLVLVVEDEPLVLELAVTALSECGFKTVAATTASEAVARFEEAPDRFVLVLTDLYLADGLGTSLVETLRERRPQLAALVTSGDENPFGESAPPPRTGFLEKPFRLSELGERIDVLLGAERDPGTIP